MARTDRRGIPAAARAGRVLSAILAAAILVLSGSPLLAQAAQKSGRSQKAYLEALSAIKFNPWHFNPWDAVVHPIDYWIRHSADDRREAKEKYNDFVKGVEVLPAGFTRTKVPARDLTLAGALYLVDETPRPLVVLLPGTFGSHLSSYIAETARLMALSGKFHVLLLATRMSVSSMQELKVLGSGGILESRDTLAAIRWVRTRSPFSELVTRVGLYGVSLSGDYVAQTMALDGEGLVDAGLVVAGAHNPEKVARDIDEKATGASKLRYPFAPFFIKALRMHVESLRKELGLALTDEDVKRFMLSDYGPRLSWPFYRDKLDGVLGAGADYETYRKASCALNVVEKVTRPLLAIHSHQDDWMGYEQADEFARRAARTPHVALHYVDGAGHASYFVHDPVWFHRMLDSYFSYWLDPPAAPAVHAYTGQTARRPPPPAAAAAAPVPPEAGPQQTR
jgi:predicted alpha/beta-fold hydrolase